MRAGLVIFDCDGVPVDTEALANRRLSAWLTQAGVAAGMRVLSHAGDPRADREGLAAAGGALFDDMRAVSAMIGLDQSATFAPGARPA